MQQFLFKIASNLKHIHEKSIISIKIHLQGAQNWSSFHKEGVINVNFLSSEKRAQGYKVKWSNFGTFWLLQNDFFTAKI